jgi:Putative metallopeptidase
MPGLPRCGHFVVGACRRGFHVDNDRVLDVDHVIDCTGRSPGPAEGRLVVTRDIARSILLLETVAEHATNQFAWPAPLTLKMETCGSPNARWDIRSREVVVCYELGAAFADLYREFGEMQ